MANEDKRRAREERAKRLVQARKAAGFAGPKAVEDEFGFDINKYKAHESGRNGFEAIDAEAYAKAFGVSFEWLNLGKGSMIRELTYEPDEVQQPWTPQPDQDGAGYDRESYEPTVPGAIPELDARAGAGEGAVGEVMVLPMGGGTISAHKISAEWLIPIDYLREAVGDPSRAIVLPISGDSMMPNYAPGDRVVIDLSEHELRADGVYLISDGFNAPQIKRLQIIPFAVPRKCRIISDNPAYQPQEVETDMVHIMGKISAYVGRR